MADADRRDNEIALESTREHADQRDNESTSESAREPDGKSPADGEELLQTVRNLVRRVTAARSSPHPRFLHALAAILEEEESRAENDMGQSLPGSSRPHHNTGRLISIIRENDDFSELLSSKLFVESRHSVTVKAAAARLLLACLTCGMYPSVLDDTVLSNIKQWVLDDAPKPDWLLLKRSGTNKLKGNVSTDWDMLRTFSLGLLAAVLAAGGSIIEEVLATGLAGKLMHYLRLRLLKDIKDWAAGEHRNSSSSSGKIREDIKSRPKQSSEATVHLEMPRMGNEGAVSGDKFVDKETRLENIFLVHNADGDQDVVGDENCQSHETRDLKNRLVESSSNLTGKDFNMDDSVREETSKRKGDARDRGSTKVKGKSKPNDIMNDGDGDIFMPHNGGGHGELPCEKNMSLKGNHADRNVSENLSVSCADRWDTHDGDVAEGGIAARDKEICVIVGGHDISVAVKRAASAAETEARNARASLEAVRAAGEAASDLVKASAFEAHAQSLDNESILAAAMSAARSVEEAGATTKAIRNLVSRDELKDDLDKETDSESCEPRDFALSHDVLASLKERFSVQCLQRLGEYQEVLGPVLHERGVDVCLALLQRESASSMFPKSKALLPDVLKLICSLAAHRKFSALFVDRGGVQLVLAVPRNSQTYTGISLCLFAFASIQGVMERVCTAPTEVVNEVVSLALHLLECAQDHARRNAVFFFGASFVFRAILDAFDQQDGLCKMIDLLKNAAALRSGGNSGLPGTLPSLRIDRAASAEVLTSSEKQIAYHTCVALRQYFRAHLLILVDTIRPYRSRNGVRMFPSCRASYKPLDVSNEAMESLIMQIQRDRKLGAAFVRARWPTLETFMHYSGHLVLLELTQVGPGERYVNDIAQHALGVLQIVTLMPVSRKPIISSMLSNHRSSMSALLDAANATVFSEAEVIQAALLVLVNLVCPPPSLSSRLSQQSSSQTSQLQFSAVEAKERQEKVGSSIGNSLGSISPGAALVGDRRISLGSVAGGSGMAAYIEQSYKQACDAVRANNGIKVLLHLLYPKPVLPPSSLDCIRALACRVLLGLARDDAIAHILTKLQVGKLLSELLRDSGCHFGRTTAATGAGEQGRWYAELGQVSMELMTLVTNAGRAGTLVTSDAAAPTLRRIERAAIAAATPISYPSQELLQLIHEHLLLSGLPNAASTLLEEARLKPLPSSLAVQGHTAIGSRPIESIQEAFQWPNGRITGGFMVAVSKPTGKKDEPRIKLQNVHGSAPRKSPIFTSACQRSLLSSTFQRNKSVCLKVENRDDSTEDDVLQMSGCRLGEFDNSEASRNSVSGSTLPNKRKFLEDENIFPPNKRIATAESNVSSTFCTSLISKNHEFHSNCSLNERGPIHVLRPDKPQWELSTIDEDPSRPLRVQGDLPNQIQMPVSSLYNEHFEPQSVHHSERVTLDTLVVQYLKHQHRQCPAPITTLPPLSLFHSHVCPEPSRASYAPYNLAGRLAAREVLPPYGGTHACRRNKHYLYSRFRPWRQCKDDRILLTSSTFVGTTFRLAAGSDSGEIRLFDCYSGDVLETHQCHVSPIVMLHSAPHALGGSVEVTEMQPGHLLLSSGSSDVRLWKSSMLGENPLYSFDDCKAARFNNRGDVFACISLNSQKEVLLYDVQTGQQQQKLNDTSHILGLSRGSSQCIPHFSPSDTLLLWNGILWDHRLSHSVHRFDQFTDYGGGGFHPAGNEVIINSEVWDLRTYKLLRSVPSLEQTAITFNATGDIIYAILRRNPDDIMSAIHPRRNRHPLFAAFRTIDAFDYTDIATISVDRCILDLATERTDTLISVVALEWHEGMDALAKLYEVGRRKPTEDDSDPDDGAETDDDEDSLVEEEAVEEVRLEANNSDLDASNIDESGDEAEEDDIHEDEEDEAVEVDGSVVEIMTDGSEGELPISFSSEEGSFVDYEEDDDDDFNDMLEMFLS